MNNTLIQIISKKYAEDEDVIVGWMDGNKGTIASFKDPVMAQRYVELWNAEEVRKLE